VGKAVDMKSDIEIETNGQMALTFCPNINPHQGGNDSWANVLCNLSMTVPFFMKEPFLFFIFFFHRQVHRTKIEKFNRK
jgi:hypothetical protein